MVYESFMYAQIKKKSYENEQGVNMDKPEGTGEVEVYYYDKFGVKLTMHPLTLLLYIEYVQKK